MGYMSFCQWILRMWKNQFFVQLIKDNNITDMVYPALWEFFKFFFLTLDTWNAQQSNCLVAIKCLFFKAVIKKRNPQRWRGLRFSGFHLKTNHASLLQWVSGG